MHINLDAHSAVDPANTHAQQVSLVPGLNTICTAAYGTYDVRFIGCHTYDTNELPLTIDIANHAPITINAIKHRSGVRILSDTVATTLTLQADAKDWSRTVQPTAEPQLVDGQHAYRYDFDLQPEERVTLTPHSDTMLFQPANAQLVGGHDCVTNARTFRASRGLIVDGRIQPPLGGARVVMSFPQQADRSPIETTSDKDGRFTFGPLDKSVQYDIVASKESYVFTDYDRQRQTFGAHKLCEIVATVRDEAGAALAGVLLSLSGAGTYRKNLVTGEDGTIKFHSLSPSQYYLRPMMKEYRFEPNSKVIDIKDGQTVEVQLDGKRVAYSVMGAVRTLNGDPFGGAVIETEAVEPCGQHQEEATTEPNGVYRIRGLQPGCEYVVRVKQGAATEATVADSSKTADGDAANVVAAASVDRTIPLERRVQVQHADIADVHFVAITPITYVDVIARIKASSNEFYKTLRVQLYRRGASDSPIYSQRVEQPLNVKGRVNPGIMVFFPRIPFDGRTYYVELTSSLSEKMYRYTLPVQSFVANRSSVFVEVDFEPEVRSLDGDLSQNSLSALLLIAVLAVAFFKQNLAFDFFNFLWTRFVDAVEHALSKNGTAAASKKGNDGVIDENEIEKLAQSINATKRSKVRRT